MANTTKEPDKITAPALTSDQKLSFWAIGGTVLTLWALNWAGLAFKDTERGTTGDMFGIFNSLFAGLSFSALIYTLYLQINQNKIQQKEIEDARNEIEYQHNTDQLQSFENRFYEQLKVHRENVESISIAELVKGRKAFVSMFNEFKFTYFVTKLVCESEKELNQDFKMPSGAELVNISFLIFYLGTGPSSDKLTKKFFAAYDQSMINALLKKLREIRLNKENKDSYLIETGDPEDPYIKFKMNYLPFGGHTSRLGHYYRHLFQTVTFIVEQNPVVVKDHYQYVKTLRAQLSDHEQLLLYYNGLSLFGKGWIDRGYFTDYRMIRNIPLPLASFGIKPDELLGTHNSANQKLFEWDEIIDLTSTF